MIKNIMEEYTEFTRNFIHKLMQEFFREKYDEEIVEQYIETYIDARYNNYGGNEKQRIFYRRIYSALQKKSEQLQEKNQENNEVIINILEVFQYVFYIDFVRTLKIDLREFVNQMYERRTIKFNIKRNKDFRDNTYRMIKKFRDEKEKYLEAFETDDFELVTIKYPHIKDIYKVDLKYKFKMPYIFSKEVINEVFNENVVNEDKLIAEYVMLTVFNIKMILQGKFNTQYLVDLPATMYGKKQKLKQILNIINYPEIQDKIKIKIKYRDFILNREHIYELMKEGYKFVIIIDDSFIISDEHIKKLEIFDYILINNKLKNFEEFQDRTKRLENIIIDEID